MWLSCAIQIDTLKKGNFQLICEPLKTFAVISAIVCCLFTSSAVCDASLYCPGRNKRILDSRNYGALGKSSNKALAQLKNLLYKNSVSKWLSMLSKALCSFVATFGCLICPKNHFLENAALLFVARSVFFSDSIFSASSLNDFSCFVSKCRFILDVRQTMF